MNCIDCVWAIQEKEKEQCQRASPTIRDCKWFKNAKRRMEAKMRQTICDRCGKILPSYRDVTKLILSNYVSIQDTSYDLCKGCTYEMNNLIKSEIKNHEKNGVMP